MKSELIPYKFVRDMDDGNQMLPRADGTYYRRKDVEKLVAAMEAERNAALAGAVRVRGLVWNSDRQVGTSPLGKYRIVDLGDHWVAPGQRFDLTLNGQYVSDHPSREAAVSAAETHHEASVRAALEPDPERMAAWQDVLAERQRQINAEGWTPEHDDAHEKGEIADAAACYAILAGKGATANEHDQPGWWPWHWTWWRSTTRRRDLVKAGALILAEIERLDRAALKGGAA